VRRCFIDFRASIDKDPEWAVFETKSERIRRSDIDSGILKIQIGLAPLQPAEFVVMKIKRLPHVLC